MSLANALKKAASASLKKLGGDVTIRQVTAGAYNTTTGAISESTSDTTHQRCVEWCFQKSGQ